MSEINETEINEPILDANGEVVPSIETPVTPEPVVIPELRYEYQPTDEQGRPIGGKQVIKYTTPDDLAAKFAEQNTLLVRKLRDETKKNRLGISDSTPIEGARYVAAMDFTPKTLTNDERYKLSRNLQDPDKFEEARDLLFESSFGVKPSDLTATIQGLQADNIQMKAKQEADAFVAATPDYVKCAENFEAITSWMVRYDLAPVQDNFRKAFDTLKAAGVLVESNDVYNTPSVTPTPEVQLEVPAALDQQTPPQEAIVEKPVVFAPANIPTGLNSRNSSAEAPRANTAGSAITYTHTFPDGRTETFTGSKAIEMMPSDELRRRSNRDPNFNKLLEKLEAEQQARRAARK
jgi:hypothetical protein